MDLGFLWKEADFAAKGAQKGDGRVEGGGGERGRRGAVKCPNCGTARCLSGFTNGGKRRSGVTGSAVVCGSRKGRDGRKGAGVRGWASAGQGEVKPQMAQISQMSEMGRGSA
jgi:hypothetical protein